MVGTSCGGSRVDGFGGRGARHRIGNKTDECRPLRELPPPELHDGKPTFKFESSPRPCVETRVREWNKLVRAIDAPFGAKTRGTREEHMGLRNHLMRLGLDKRGAVISRRAAGRT